MDPRPLQPQQQERALPANSCITVINNNNNNNNNNKENSSPTAAASAAVAQPPPPPTTSAKPSAGNVASLDLSSLDLTPRSEAARVAAAAAAAGRGNEGTGMVTATAAEALAQLVASQPPLPLLPTTSQPPPPPPPPPPLPPRRRVRVRIEARINPSHPASASPPNSPPRAAVERELLRYLRHRSIIYTDGPLALVGASPELASAVDALRVVDAEAEGEAPLGTMLLFWQVELRVTAYAVSTEPAAVPPALDGGGDEAEAPPYKELVLPHASLEGSMEAIVLPPRTKSRMLRRLGAALALGGAGVDPRLVPSGRLALLHGPPGTGKTSLCRAVAQRLAIRLCSNGTCDSGDGGGGGAAGTSLLSSSSSLSSLPSRFPGGALLLEVSAPALFSKWFSESGRAVARLFDRVSSLATEEQALVFVLIDEVESLAGSRTGGGGSGGGSGGGGGGGSGGGGGDPGDAMRAVNALLTGLDALRDSAPGTCVLCTSNLGGTLDAAFVDRADVVLRLGTPPAQARYSMLAASVAELARARVVGGVRLVPVAVAPSGGSSSGSDGGGSWATTTTMQQQQEQHQGGRLWTEKQARELPKSLPEEVFAAFSASLSSSASSYDNKGNDNNYTFSASSALEFFSRWLPPLAARLASVAAVTEGFSGRSLRRLPFAALSDNVGLAGLEEAATASASAAAVSSRSSSSSISSSAAAAAAAPPSAPPPSSLTNGSGLGGDSAIDALSFMDALAAAAEAERSSRKAL